MTKQPDDDPATRDGLPLSRHAVKIYALQKVLARARALLEEADAALPERHDPQVAMSFGQLCSWVAMADKRCQGYLDTLASIASWEEEQERNKNQ